MESNLFTHSTSALENLLTQVKPEEFSLFLKECDTDLIWSERPFTEYMRKIFREKVIRQQDVFIAADLPDHYGYKLISGEKHTTQRDTVIRICLSAHFQLEEAQMALILYGVAPLYCRFPRDAAIMLAFLNGIYDIHEVEAILKDNNLLSFVT